MTGTERPAGEKEMREDTRSQTGPMGLQEEVRGRGGLQLGTRGEFINSSKAGKNDIDDKIYFIFFRVNFTTGTSLKGS